MLFVAAEEVPGRYVELESTPFAPPAAAGPIGADEYLGYLRALYRQKPELFLHWARSAHTADETIVGDHALVTTLYIVLVKVGHLHGWSIGGGLRRIVRHLRR